MKIYLYILVMAVVTYLIRMLPLVIVRKPIKNRFFRSFLYYLPYVTLAVMTFPAIIDQTGNYLAGILALAAGAVAAWFGLGLLPVALIASAAVFLVQIISQGGFS